MASVPRKALPISSHLSPSIISALETTSSRRFNESATLVESGSGSTASLLPYDPDSKIPFAAHAYDGAWKSFSASHQDHYWENPTNSFQPAAGGFQRLTEGDEDFSSNPKRVNRNGRSTGSRPSRRRRGFHWLYRHIGYWKLSVVLAGTIFQLGVVAWLIFVWRQTSLTTNPFWRWLILRDYLNISVVVCTALIRIIIAAQAAVATEMIASIVLEGYGTKFSRSATVSMLRAYGNHPVDLIINWPFSSRAWPMTICAVVLTMTTLSSQLSSALLVSDLQAALVTGNSQLADTNYGLGWDQIYILPPQDYSRTSPSLFPMFAEFKNSTGLETEPAIDDTGPVIRAILPISSVPTRQSISKYVGYATLVNTRVICMPPKVKSASYTYKVPDYYKVYQHFPYIIGSMSMGDYNPVGLDRGNLWNLPERQNFSGDFRYNCVLQTTILPSEWPIGLCIADIIYPTPFLLVSSPFISPIYLPSTYIMVNFSGRLPPANEYTDTPAPVVTDWVYSHSSPASPWTNMQSPSLPGVEINLSLCLTSFQTAEANITATASSDRTEPTLIAVEDPTLHVTVDSQDRNSVPNITYVFNTSDVILQLGADGSLSNYEKRGIMTLQPKDQWSNLVTTTKFGPTILTSDPRLTVLDGAFGFNDITIQESENPKSNKTWGLCSFCGVYENPADFELDYTTKAIDLKLASIFQGSLARSLSPATALQALFTVANFTQYYDRVAYLQISNTSETTLFEIHLQPVGYRGLLIVTSIVGLHFVFFFVVVGYFLRMTKLSVLGDTWRSLAQMDNEDARRLISVSGMSTEREVEAWINKNGLGDVLVRLEEQEGSVEGQKGAKLKRLTD